MKRSPEEIKAMVEKVKQMNTAGMVCDSGGACDGWSKWHYLFDSNIDWKFFKFCPFCGYPISWDWERLK